MVALTTNRNTPSALPGLMTKRRLLELPLPTPPD